jgi:group I intron endonuclease
MKTILIIKLLITFSIIKKLITTKNFELNKLNIEFVQELIKDKLEILFPNSNLNDLLYLVKLILLEINFGEIYTNNDNNSTKLRSQNSLDYVNNLSLEVNIQENKLIELISFDHLNNSKSIILECLKRLNQEYTDMKYLDFPILIFSNSLLSKKIISNQLKNYSGIYCWYCKPTGNMYVGSAVDLRVRTSDYYQFSYIKNRKHLPIIRAMQKYGMDQFCLIILEFSNKESLIRREQYWIDFITPSYNILTVAGSWLGNKHLEETKQKISTTIKGRNHKLETKLNMSLARQKEDNPFYGRTHSLESKTIMSAYQSTRLADPNPGISINVFSLDNNLLFTFKSIRETAKHFKADTRTITRFLDSNQLFRNEYYIVSKLNK